MGNIPKRVALVYDWVDTWGGAERALLVLHEMFPDAPLYTGVYDPVRASLGQKYFLKYMHQRLALNMNIFLGYFHLSLNHITLINMIW